MVFHHGGRADGTECGVLVLLGACVVLKHLHGALFFLVQFLLSPFFLSFHLFDTMYPTSVGPKEKNPGLKRNVYRFKAGRLALEGNVYTNTQ